MSVDLTTVMPGSDPLNGVRIGKAAVPPSQEEQTAKAEDVAFEALLSSMDKDGGFQTEGSAPPPQQSVSQQQPERRPAARAKPDAAQPGLTPNQDLSAGSALAPQRATGDINWPALYSAPLVQQAVVSAAAKTDSGPAPTANAALNSNLAAYSREISPSGPMRPSLKQVFAAAAGADSAYVGTTKAKEKGSSSEGDDEVAPSASAQAAPPMTLQPPSQPVLHWPLQSAPEQSDAVERRQSLSPAIFTGEKNTSLKDAKAKPSVTVLAKQELPGPALAEPNEPPFGSNSGSPFEILASASPRRQNNPDKVQATEAPPETIKNVTIHSLETHLPVVLSNMVAGWAPIPSEPGQSIEGEQRNVSIHVGPTPPATSASQQMDAPIKIVTIQLEPESLGNVTVKMKMSRSNVDLHISVDSHDALRALGASHDKLVEAIQSTGCSVSSYTVDAGAAAPASDGAQNPTGFGNQNLTSSGPDIGSRHENIGREGGENGGRNANQQENPRDSRHRQTSDVVSPRDADRLNGVYL
jgi:flagellar hook-length control protein FliK